MSWVDAGQDSLGPIQLARVRVQHLVTFLLATVGGAYAIAFASIGLHLAAAVLVVVMGSSVAGLFGLTRRGHHNAGGVVVSVGYWLTITNALVARGGMTSNSASWLLLAPVLAFLMVGRRHGIVITVASIVVFVGVWAAEMLGVAMPSSVPDLFVTLMVVVDYPVMAFTLAGLLWIQAGIWDPVIADLASANADLRREIDVRERAEIQAREAAKARNTFLATMSHEIRTPLNGVLGLTEVLLETELTADQTELASSVRGSGELLRSVLDDVLDFSRIESGHLDLESIPFDVRSLCEQVVAAWRGAATERGLALECRWEGAPHWVTGDPTRVRQIVGNLVSNAVKFTEIGHVIVRVSMPGALVIQVQDSGIGLDEGTVHHIFEPFRQADGTHTRRFGGAGLGLAICRHLAVAMGGSLDVESQLGHGTTFTLALPISGTDEPSMQPDDDDLTAIAGRRVLIAEDNPVNQVVLRRLLERYGAQVIVASDGDECVRLWEQQKPDMILMDCQMPLCDGYQATQRIRRAGGELPIVAVTANSVVGDRARSLASGMDDHITKPIRPVELEQTLITWLRAGSSRRSA